MRHRICQTQSKKTKEYVASLPVAELVCDKVLRCGEIGVVEILGKCKDGRYECLVTKDGQSSIQRLTKAHIPK